MDAREAYAEFYRKLGLPLDSLVPYTDENEEALESIREKARREGLCMKEDWCGCGYPHLTQCDGCPVL